MKIEKINNNQIKFTLTQDDLLERDIELPELVFGSEKSQSLFKEIMTEAFHECDFDVENTPVMIEATPLSSKGIMIIVTKVTEDFDIEDGTSLIPDTRIEERYKVRDLTSNNTTVSQNVFIYSFDSLDLVSLACKTIVDKFECKGSLFKKLEKYYLVAYIAFSEEEKVEKESEYDAGYEDILSKLRKKVEKNDNTKSVAVKNLDAMLNEYGKKHLSSNLSEEHLKEHYEIIIDSDAINKMAKL